MAKEDKGDKDDKDHKEASGKKVTRKEVITTTEDITNKPKEEHGSKWSAKLFALAVLAAFVFGSFMTEHNWRSTQLQQRTGTETPPAAKHKILGPLQRTLFGGRPQVAAPNPLINESSGPTTTGACAGIKHTVILHPGMWVYTDKNNYCRVVAYVPPDVRMEAMDADGTIYPYPDPNQDPVQQHSVLKVRTLDQTIRFSFSRCPRDTSGMLNWDCTPIRQYAVR